MPTSTSMLAFAALSVVLIAVPGPSVVFVLSRTVSLGRRAGLVSVLGNAVGVYVQIAAVALGLGLVVQQSVAVFTTVKLVGAAYLVWLGVQAIRHRHEMAHVVDAAGATKRISGLLVEGFVVGVANPKAIVFFAAVLPQYVNPAGAPPGLQMLVLGLVFVAIALVSDGLWSVGAATTRDWLLGSPRRLERMGGMSGLAMIGLGAGLAVSGRPE